jgi:hypothetical protein
MFISATATDPLGNTSAFAQDVLVTGTAAPGMKPVVLPSSGSSPFGYYSGNAAISREAVIESLAMELIRSRRRAGHGGSG